MQRLSAKIKAVNIPHFKTNKSSYIVNEQLGCGAGGITCAKLSEAQLLTKKRVKNIILAYPVIGKENYQRFLNLLEYSNIIPVFDCIASIKKLDEYLRARTLEKVDYYLEIDTGLNRLGVLPDLALKIINRLQNSTKVLNLKGILSHAGHSYSAKNVEEVYKIAEEEYLVMKKIREDVENENNIRLEISLGATPTLKSGFLPEGVTNIRPGNYVFNDAIGVHIGYSKEDECALRVITRVISRHGNRLVIDAGSKSLGLDLGVHGNRSIDSYGLIVDHPGSDKIVKDMKIIRLSEEHGIIRNLSDKKIKTGDIIEIIPNHSCFVANLFDHAYLIEDEKIIDKIEIDGRGLNT